MKSLLKEEKRILILAGLIILPTLLFAQPDTIPIQEKARSIAWFTPCGATKINGLAVGFQAMQIDGGILLINGVNADIGMGGIVAVPYVIVYSLSPKKKKIADFLVFDTASTIINGLSLSLGGELSVSVNGVNITGGVTGASTLNGISITGVYSKCNVFRGICISGLNNIAIKGVGIQVGLFNYCKQLKGIQIGLWNKSGNRGLPFVNWGI